MTVGKTEAEVATTDINSPAVCIYQPNQLTAREHFFCKKGLYGRYVRLATLGENKQLQVVEIEVYGI